MLPIKKRSTIDFYTPEDELEEFMAKFDYVTMAKDEFLKAHRQDKQVGMREIGNQVFYGINETPRQWAIKNDGFDKEAAKRRRRRLTESE